MSTLDCLIVGAGPAGLTAALDPLSVAVGHAAVAATAVHNSLK
jgi:ribulose 1,5-bisphosphate synthetase/thiazole synthase